MQEKLSFYEDKMNMSLEALQNEYGSIRAGRANPHVLDKLKVDYYGTPTPLQQVGNISVPEARMIVIQPWEKSLLKAIEKAILTSDLGINPTNDGTCIRLVFPELTEERRKELAKDVKKKEVRSAGQTFICLWKKQWIMRRRVTVDCLTLSVISKSSRSMRWILEK